LKEEREDRENADLVRVDTMRMASCWQHACASWREVPVSSDADHAARDTALAADHPRTDEAEQQRAAEPTPQRPLGRRVRALAARSRHPFAHGPAPDRPLEELIGLHRAAHPRADTRVLQLAYEVADREHRGQQRTSGEPFINHPLAVASILAELGMDTTTLVAALLHDTVEDTGYTLEQTRDDFGDQVAHLVDGLTKLDKVEFGQAAEAETIRKMIIATAVDLRVLIVKLADRLHNMRTLRFQPAHKQERTARATLEVLTPLANRLGLQVLKRELEDVAFATLHPAEHDQIVQVVESRAPSRREHLEGLRRQVHSDLRSARIKATVDPHPRHYYSIYQTMLELGSRDIHDPDRLLVVVAGSASDCYIALGAIHGRWHPVPGRFKDFIAAPKLNGYQSLHTTVIGPGDEPVEVHIRTETMHRTAEYGVVAQAREARNRRAASNEDDPGNADDLVWLHRLLDWQRAVSDPGEFLESLRSDLTDHEVLVFTPTGDALTLPMGATPVDMAYALRTELGHRCIGARVNGQLVPLASALADGDVVEVLTSASDHPGPSKEWLGFVKSPQAHVKIRQWLAERNRDDAIGAGQQAIDRALAEVGWSLERATEDGSLAMLDYADLEALYRAVGQEQLSAQSVAQWLVTVLGDQPDSDA
jgi:GTP diphosphokinase / guanosine-3',5'-bis(diphosphate) 3'-diphosphatase